MELRIHRVGIPEGKIHGGHGTDHRSIYISICSIMRAVPLHVVTFPCVILSSLFLPLTVLQPIDWWFCARSFVLIVLDSLF